MLNTYHMRPMTWVTSCPQRVGDQNVTCGSPCDFRQKTLREAESHQCWGAWVICRSWLLSPVSDGLQNKTMTLTQHVGFKHAKKTKLLQSNKCKQVDITWVAALFYFTKFGHNFSRWLARSSDTHTHTHTHTVTHITLHTSVRTAWGPHLTHLTLHSR